MTTPAEPVTGDRENANQASVPSNSATRSSHAGRALADRPAGEHDHQSPEPAQSQIAGNDESHLVAGEESCADANQTLSDGDQTGSDSDQTSADRDQLAADRDQEASDRDLASGVDPGTHQLTRDIREQTTRQRELTAQARLDAADTRDATADARDLSALARDQAAAARDIAMAQRDIACEQDLGLRALTGADIIMRAAEQRRRAAQHRAQAAEHRVLAAEDRYAAAQDREQAARERRRAFVDRKALAQELEMAATDPLTGARTRAAGLIDLDNELDRCRRSRGVLAVAYVDVDGLKALNDSQGHGAGDELLTRVVALISGHLRSYDLVIRHGGDEFLCAMSNMTVEEARQRFSTIAAALAATPAGGAISTGFAELTPDDNATDLITRADSELIGARRTINHNTRPRPTNSNHTHIQ